jgi:Helix-turn-helix domain
MKARGRPNPSSGMVLKWQRALKACRSIPTEKPPRYAVLAVALVLVGYSDPNGRHCRPGVGTIVWEAGISKRTVVLALDWLAEHGWLEIVKRTGTSPTEYRLVIPAGAQEDQSGTAPEQDQNDSPVVLQSTSRNGAGGAPAGALAGALEHPNLPTSVAPKGAEEEEECFAPCAAGAAPVAAHQEEAMPLDDDVLAICADIAAGAGVLVEAGRLAQPLAEAKRRAGWNRGEVGAYCVEKVKRNKPRDPTAWLATDLTKRVSAHTVKSPRMQLAGVMADLEAIRAYDLAGFLPLERLWSNLIDAGVIKEGDALHWWAIKDVHVEKATAMGADLITTLSSIYPQEDQP